MYTKGRQFADERCKDEDVNLQNVNAVPGLDAAGVLKRDGITNNLNWRKLS